jgi:hypothetical protein
MKAPTWNHCDDEGCPNYGTQHIHMDSYEESAIAPQAAWINLKGGGMKTEQEIRSEFEEWCNDAPKPMYTPHDVEKAWQACAATYEAQLAEKGAEIALLWDAIRNMQIAHAMSHEAFCDESYWREEVGTIAKQALGQTT